MENPIENLRNKIFAKKALQPSELTAILDFGREFGCLGEIVGRNYEVLDKQGKVIYRIVQKPLSIPVLRTLLEELELMRKIEEQETKNKMPKTPSRGRRR